MRKTFSTRLLAMVMASLFGIGIQIKNFVKLHMTVMANLFPLSVTVRGPMVSTERESKGLFGVCNTHR